MTTANDLDNLDNELEFDDLDQTEFTKAGETINRTHSVTDSEIGIRLDKLCADVFDGFSRVQLQTWIESGDLTVNGTVQKCKYRVKSGDVLALTATLEAHGEDLPENIPLDVVYQDADVLVINKPAGLVVHPGAGNRTGTLVNALLYHYPDQAHLPRAGLVHRIDKDTTGLLVVARTKSAQLNLMAQLKDKTVYRLYQCIAWGVPSDILRHSTIDLPIARHSSKRTKMAVRDSGKPAVTHIVKAAALGEHYSLLDVRLETGRTHQIRVHLSHLGFALLGDKVYGSAVRGSLSMDTRQLLQSFPRQAPHAHTLGFTHPTSGQAVEFYAPLPDDMLAIIDALVGS